jgi:hypothetical protein
MNAGFESSIGSCGSNRVKGFGDQDIQGMQKELCAGFFRIYPWICV